jgi:hypothetical protein
MRGKRWPSRRSWACRCANSSTRRRVARASAAKSSAQSSVSPYRRNLPMKLSAVLQAKARLGTAERSLAAFRSATEIEVAEEAWTNFLISVSAIYSKLEQGAKDSNKSSPWFGEKKHERKVDPLLRYLHLARNSNEHGIERVVSTTPNNRWQGRELKFNERIPVKISPGDPVTGPTGPFVGAVAAGSTLTPIRVYDTKHGGYCDPPETHFGVAIQLRGFVDGLAEVAIPYFRKVLTEAEALIEDAQVEQHRKWAAKNSPQDLSGE